MKNKFWAWENRADPDSGAEERVLELYGEIAPESWFDDDVTPQMFRDELFAGDGPVTVFISSPGGDCVAASQIYTMLMEYKGPVTVKIDGLAASAASVVAMAGTTVLMAPTACMMIHNPATIAFGEAADMQKAIDMLGEVKESIINAYQLKTGLSRAKLSRLMDDETWMDCRKAIELGFADGMLEDSKRVAPEGAAAYAFSSRAVERALLNRLGVKDPPEPEPEPEPAPEREPEPDTAPAGRSVDALLERLNTIKNFM